MRNVFETLSEWFSGGREDFFTATLALFLERNEAFRDEFLMWLMPHMKDDLLARRWVVSAQVSYPSCKGNAVLDMVLQSRDLELWFEHKVGSSAGKYGEIDQLEKYLDAAARVMLGNVDSKTNIQWPTNGPIDQAPRVALFFVTRDAKSLDRGRYEGRLYSGSARYGFVWPPQGHLRWRDFWVRAEGALDGVLRGGVGEYERTLAQQFLRYWRSMRGMWKNTDVSTDWTDLLPDRDELPEGQPCGFDDLWAGVRTIATERLGCSRVKGWRGYQLELSLPADASPAVDQVTVNPVHDVANQKNCSEKLGAYVLKLLFRPRKEFVWPVFRSEAVFDKRWRGTLRCHKADLEVLVEIADWESCRDVAKRCQSVADAFWAGLSIVHAETGVEFRGIGLC